MPSVVTQDYPFFLFFHLVCLYWFNKFTEWISFHFISFDLTNNLKDFKQLPSAKVISKEDKLGEQESMQSF